MLDHALSGSEGADNCNKFIEILGLRTIFPLFMKTPKKHGIKGLSKEQVTVEKARLGVTCSRGFLFIVVPCAISCKAG